MHGLHGDDRRAYLNALTSTHRIRVKVNVFNGNEERKEALEQDIIGGQVDVDEASDITRTLTLTFANKRGKMAWGPNSQVFADNFLQVFYCVYVQENDLGWVNVPVFFGPVSRYESGAGEATVEAVGKESLLLPPRPYRFPPNPEGLAGRSLRDFIRREAESMGESKFRLGNMGGARISKREATDAAKAADEGGLWVYLSKLAAANDFKLFYNPEGELSARPMHGRHGYHFHDGEGGAVLEQPNVSYDLSELRNEVVVKGKDSHGKNVTKAIARLPAQHPLSADSLKWNGEERILREVKRYDHDIKIAKAKDVARTVLRNSSRAPVSVQFESLVIPHLELDDRCELETEGNPQAVKFKLNSFSIPLDGSGSMSVGFTKPYRKQRRLEVKVR
jgi:hypothetical protein